MSNMKFPYAKFHTAMDSWLKKGKRYACGLFKIHLAKPRVKELPECRHAHQIK